MPKAIELTVELEIQRVSCPGVWLCQDGRVSLTVFTLGTSYQTCLLPPSFPIVFKDCFFYRKRYKDTCSLNNLCCLLKNETIYCELVQWSDDCHDDDCTILAQYLGALNDILFPSNMCSSEGVDLLMRRTKNFPGILSPKIEIATKVRIDEMTLGPPSAITKSLRVKQCVCQPKPEPDGVRQKQVCHTPMFHRVHCTKQPARSRSRSTTTLPSGESNVDCSSFTNRSRHSLRREPTCWPRAGCRYTVCRAQPPPMDTMWRRAAAASSSTTSSDDRGSPKSDRPSNPESTINKLLLKSQNLNCTSYIEDKLRERRRKRIQPSRTSYGQRVVMLEYMRAHPASATGRLHCPDATKEKKNC